MNLKQLNNLCENGDMEVNIEQVSGKPDVTFIRDVKTGRKFFV